MSTLFQDLKYGLRILIKRPGFSVVAILTLALGIGANTAIFSIVNAIVLRPLPYANSDRLVWVTEEIPALKAELASAPDYLDWRDQNQVLAGITAFSAGDSFNMTGHGTPERVHAARVSANFFATLGVSPQLGRGFTAEEDRPAGPNAVILMHSFWEQHFGSDANVLGKTITLNSAAYSVVGVMPASFHFPGEADTQMLVPLALNEASERLRGRMSLVRIIGLLKPGIALARARSDLDAIQKRSEAAMQAAGPRPGMGPMPAGGPGPAPERGTAMGSKTTANAAPRRAGAPTGLPPGVTRPAEAGRATGASPVQGPAPRPVPAPPAPARGPGGAPAPPAGGGRGTTIFVSGPPEIHLKVVPLQQHLAGNLRPAVMTLLGVVGFVLLIACTNVANLMLTRASARTREVAVRAVLGAGRWRLVRQLLAESVGLALAGGAAGLLLAVWSEGLMLRLIPASLGGNILSVAPVKLDAHVLLFTLAVAVVTGILFGLAPALAATRHDLSEGLKEGTQGATTGGRGWLQGGLAVTELSLALVLLIGAGLLIKSFYRVLSVQPGFTPEHVLTLNLSLTDSRYPSPQKRAEFFSRVLVQVQSLPGVRSAAVSDSLPLSPYRARMMMRMEEANQVGLSANNTVLLSRVSVSPSYFYTLGIPLLNGRTFTDQDDESAPKVAVVNKALADHMWPGENPVGKELHLGGDSLPVVGVVGNTRHEGLSADVESEVYVPYLQEPGSSMQLAVRTPSEPATVVSAVRAQIAAIDPEQPIYNITTLEETLSSSLAPRRFNMLLLGIFAAIALALATVGVYGVMAFSVSQRTHEIGIRMALGAEQGDVLGLIVRQGLRLTFLGVILGVGGALALTRFLTSFLYGVQPRDPMTFVLVSSALVMVSVLAAYIPARRATKVDPITALRYE